MGKLDKDIAIRVSDVSKEFVLNHEATSSVKSGLIQLFRRNRRQVVKDKLQVLKGVSFDIKKGDFVGIVGRNGGGKSTLLKIIAGIYQPTSGSVTINGTLIPFIELGVGFNPELTGRENIYLNGALFGFSKKQVEAMYDEIVDFAELHQFMDQKLKNYSSGMQVRLAFSIAIKAQGDILVLDEVLAVGDEAFQRKCANFFEQIKKDQTKTVILVTHSMENVRKYCNNAILLHDGVVKLNGDPDEIADEYYGVNLLDQPVDDIDKTKPVLSAKVIGKRALQQSDTLEVRIRYKALNPKPVFAKAYLDIDGQVAMATNPVKLGHASVITRDTDEHIVKYSLPLAHFNRGEYKVIALIEDVESGVNIASYGHEGQVVFRVNNPDKNSVGGLFINQAKMELES